jgi:hypothetical protein
MKGRTYRNAVIGIKRMNAILGLSLAQGAVTIQSMSRHFETDETTAKKYLHRLVDMGLMDVMPSAARKNAQKLYTAKPDAQLLPVPNSVVAPRPAVKKAGKRRIVVDECCRRVHTVPAAQVGMPRDPLVQALFGDWRAA